MDQKQKIQEILSILALVPVDEEDDNTFATLLHGSSGPFGWELSVDYSHKGKTVEGCGVSFVFFKLTEEFFEAFTEYFDTSEATETHGHIWSGHFHEFEEFLTDLVEAYG